MIAHVAINTFQSFSLPFYQRQLMYRWFQCPFRIMSFSFSLCIPCCSVFQVTFHNGWNSGPPFYLFYNVEIVSCSILCYIQIYSVLYANLFDYLLMGIFFKQNRVYCGTVYNLGLSGRMINQYDGFSSLAL